MADLYNKDEVPLPEGLAPVGGSASTRILSEPFSESAPQLPEGLDASRPDLGQRAKEVGLGAMQGAVRDVPVVAGGYAGFKLGMPAALIAAPVIGPAAALIPLATTLGGMGAGMLFGGELERWFPAVDREDLVPYREGGKTFGSSIATAPAAFGLPLMTGGRVARFVSGFGEVARRNPKTFMATEGVTAVGAGIAGGSAESYFPGREGVRFGAEMAGSILTPSKALLGAVDVAKGSVKQLSTAYAGRADSAEKKAVNLLLKALEEGGEDPERLLKALRQQIPGTVPSPTSAQKTGSGVLSDLETALGEHHAQFGGETKKQGNASLLAYQALIDNLQRVGDPQALRMAADLRQQHFDNMLNGRLVAADAKAAQKIASISKDTPQARAAIGDIVKTETELALRQARDYESELWGAAVTQITQPIPKTTPRTIGVGYQVKGREPTVTINETRLVAPTLNPSGTAEAFLKRAATIGDAIYDDSVPPVVRKIMASFGIDQAAVLQYKAGRNTQEFVDSGAIPRSFSPSLKDVPVSEMVSYRAELLKMARESAGKGDINNASFYGSLADGMLDDLGKLNNPVFDQARQFSKSLNDVFTRTFAKTATITGDVTRAGAERLPAELLVQRAFGSNADVTAQRMEQIEDAVKFMRTQYDDAVTKFGKKSPQAAALKPMAELADEQVVSIQDAQTRVLRLLASQAVETVYDNAKQAYVQKLNTKKLTTFAQQNAPMLEKLGIMEDLRDAAHAQNLLAQVSKENSAINKTVRNQTAFAQVTSVENPSRAIRDALASKFPVKNISNIAKLAKAGGTDATDGMKSSLYDYAYTKAGGNSGKFDIQAFDDALFKPIAPNQPSLVNIMRASDLMTLTEVKNMRRLLNPMVRIQTAMQNNVPLEDVLHGADAVSELAMRVVGAKIGSTLYPSGPGSLIAASAGSKAVRQMFDNLPNATVRQVLENAVKDPEAMALLLQRGRTDREKIGIGNKVLNWLGTQGVSIGQDAVTPALNYLAPDEPRPSQLKGEAQSPFTPQGVAARQLRMMPKAPTTRGVPGLTDDSKSPKKPAAAPGAGAAQNSSRSMFQSLFPFDSVSPLMGEQPPAQ